MKRNVVVMPPRADASGLHPISSDYSHLRCEVAPATGFLYAMAAGAAIWGLIGLAAWWIWRLL